MSASGFRDHHRRWNGGRRLMTRSICRRRLGLWFWIGRGAQGAGLGCCWWIIRDSGGSRNAGSLLIVRLRWSGGGIGIAIEEKFLCAPQNQAHQPNAKQHPHQRLEQRIAAFSFVIVSGRPHGQVLRLDNRLRRRGWRLRRRRVVAGSARAYGGHALRTASRQWPPARIRVASPSQRFYEIDTIWISFTGTFSERFAQHHFHLRA